MSLSFFSSFFSARDLQAPSVNRRETLPRDHAYVQFYNPGPKIRGPPQNNLGTTNAQNSVRFRTTLDFDREYPRNGSKYPNVVKKYDFVRWKKFGELWSTNILTMTHRKSTFFGKPYLSPWGLLSPQIVICALECPRLSNVHPTGNGEHSHKYTA